MQKKISFNNEKVKFLLLIVGLILIYYIGRFFHIDIKAIEISLKKIPIFYAGIIFITLYVIITFFIWLSKDIFRFMAAVLYGPGTSTLFIWLAEIINCLILFSLARYLGRGFVEKYLRGKGSNLDEKLAKTNFFWLFLFRMVPLLPFRFLDLAAGLTAISFKRYLAVVIFASPLRIFWVQYILYGVGKNLLNNPYALVEYLISNKYLFIFSLFYLILVILVASKIKKGVSNGRRKSKAEER